MSATAIASLGDKLPPELADEERGTGGQLSDRGDELGACVCVRRIVDERADVVGAQVVQPDARDAVEAREPGKRVGELTTDLLARLAEAGDDEHARPGRRSCQPGEQEQRLAVRPVDVLGHEQQRAPLAEPAEEAADGRLQQEAVGRRVRSGRGLRRGREPRERGQQPRQGCAVVGERGAKSVGIADAQEELEPLEERLVRHRHGRVRHAVADDRAALRRLVCELAHQPRLASARLAAEEDETAFAALGALEQRSGASPSRVRDRRTETATT